MSRPISSAAEAEHHAARVRQDLTATLDQLKDNLTPSRLAHEALAAGRRRTPDWMLRSWEFAASPAGIGLIGAAAASIGVTLVKSRSRRRLIR